MTPVMAGKQMNILFLGGAKRVSMARMMMDAGRKRGLEVRIFSYELSERVPIACVATVVKGLRWSEPHLMEHLQRVVEENGISVIVPFVDPAVTVAARFCESHPEVFAPVSPHHLCDAMFDKILAADMFENAMIDAPEVYRKGRPVFPLIAKPRNGSASKGIHVIRNATDFRKVIAPSEAYLIQEYIERRDEYTVDCYVSRNGEICCISPRRRLEVTGGEVSRTVTVDDPDLISATRNALTRLGLRGAVTVQFLREHGSNRLLIMEINPRLGGGAVCTVHAGGNLPGFIIDEALGLAPQPVAKVKTGVEIARYFDEVVFRNNN